MKDRRLRNMLIRITFSLSILLFALCFIHGQPVNDLPCNSIELNVGLVCETQTFTNLDATDSGIPLTQCGSYSGGDVWFSVTVPYSGKITAKLESEAILQYPDNNGWIYRPGLAIYSGTCDAPVFDTCWIDEIHESPPRKPEITIEGLTPDETLYLRVWEFANNDNGQFRICVTDPEGLQNAVEIPEGFSPNADGLNDLFEIVGILSFPENNLRVFNSRGIKVFTAGSYANQWEGKANTGLSNGKDLASGTYYYILELIPGAKPLKGFVYIQRN